MWTHNMFGIKYYTQAKCSTCSLRYDIVGDKRRWCTVAVIGFGSPHRRKQSDLCLEIRAIKLTKGVVIFRNTPMVSVYVSIVSCPVSRLRHTAAAWRRCTCPNAPTAILCKRSNRAGPLSFNGRWGFVGFPSWICYGGDQNGSFRFRNHRQI